MTRVRTVLEEGLSVSASLECDIDEIVPPGEGSTSLLREKITAGGFSAVSLNSADDLRNKADHLALSWQSRFGDTRGLQRYTHVQSLVLSDAATAFEEAKAGGDPFGATMLEHLRSRLRERAHGGGAAAGYDASAEHLEGFAFGLTALCRVVWSIARPWESE